MRKLAVAVLLVVVAACAKKKTATIPQANPSMYSRLVIGGDPDVSGVFDPYPVWETGQQTGWLAYSGVDYVTSSGNLVQDVQTNLASSSDGGLTWTFRQTVAPPRTNASFTMPDTSLCGTSQCTGHFIAEVPFLVDDATDPDPNRRWKLFEHRYLLYPPGQAAGTSLQYATGAIYLQTAASPDGAWTAGTPVLGWNATPPEIAPAQNVQMLGASTAPCVVISEGAGFARAGEIDLAFACVYFQGSTPRQKIVLLRSTDHAASFQAAGDLVATTDVASIGGVMPTAPGLAWDGTKAHLLVTPIAANGKYAGCGSVAFDPAAGTIAKSGGKPAWDLFVPTQDSRFGGACSWAPGASSDGILMIQLDLDTNPSAPFSIYETHVDP